MNDIVNFFKDQTLLIVEDKYETVNLMVEILGPFFKSVYCAQNGIEAIKTYDEYNIDIIFCDISLPKLSGFDVVNYIRKKSYNVPILIISAYSDNQTLLKASNSKIQGFLTKPIIYSELKNSLIKLIPYIESFKNKYSYSLSENIIYYPKTLELEIDNLFIPLTLKEKRLLSLLINNINSTVVYSEIENYVWTKNNNSMTMDSLRTLVKNIRKKVKYDLIITIPKIGYKMINN